MTSKASKTSMPIKRLIPDLSEEDKIIEEIG